MKAGKWRTLKVGEGKQRVWLPSGEEILSRSGILSWQEDLAHLRNHCDLLDRKQAKRDSRKLRDEQKIDERRKEESLKKKASSKVIVEDEETSESEEDKTQDDDFTVKEVTPKRRKIDLMGPMSAAADRANLSCREMALMGAAAAKGMGVKVSDTNCSVMTAHRQRTSRRNKLAEEIRSSWTAPDAGILHWDGKALKIRRGETGNYIAIYLSGVEDKVPSTLLGVPRAPGGTGKEEFQVIKATLEERMVEGVKVVGLVFDTTLTNTGEWEGVCRYLCKGLYSTLALMVFQLPEQAHRATHPLVRLQEAFLWWVYLHPRFVHVFLHLRAPHQVVHHHRDQPDQGPWEEAVQEVPSWLP